MNDRMMVCIGARVASGLGVALAIGMSSTLAAEPPAATAAAAPTAEAQVTRGEFSTRAEPLPRLPPVASEGGCEPHYRNGLVGTCINHEPCRGFGVRNPDGSASCVCYVRRSGCAQDERCDARDGQCVKDDDVVRKQKR